MTTKLTFRMWYLALQGEEKTRYRERIVKATGLSEQTIYGFVQQNRPVRKLYKEKIVDIIGFEVDFPVVKKDKKRRKAA